MKILNINNNHVSTHRYSWNKIIAELSNNINSDIILVDFMDKYFNLWFELPKHIICNNNKYSFINKDIYYHINDPLKNDVFIHYNELDIYTIMKWYPEYNEFKIMRGELIYKFKKKIETNYILEPWIGILHYPKFTEEMKYKSYEDFLNILKSHIFIKSIKYCKCIITLSQYLCNYITKVLKDNNYDIPVKMLYHPTEFNNIEFDYNLFIQNEEKKIIQIGFWMRKHNTIYNINTKYIKYWLPGGEYWKDFFSKICVNYLEYLNNTSVIIKLNLDNDEYDKLLSNNIVLLDVFNSSANNTVLECITRNTPLLVIKHPAIVEYLGIDYPLYFNDLDDLNEILNSVNFLNNIEKTYLYLKNMNKENYSIEYFINEFNKIILNNFK